MKALVIDDDDTTRTLFVELLKGESIDTEEAINGIEGLFKIKDVGPFDIIFVDWKMPEMNGVEFIENVKVDKKNAHTKIIMITGNEALDEKMMATSLGIDSYLVKPIVEEKLLEALNKINISK